MMLSSSYHSAVCEHGVCRGTLWRTTTLQKSKLKKSTSNSSAATVEDYVVLLGCKWRSFRSHKAYLRGDAPVFCCTLVGASPWNGSSTAVSGSGGGSGNSSSITSSNSDSTSFMVVTNQGTHVLAQAPSEACRNLWLQQLSTGIEQGLLQSTTTSTSTTTVANSVVSSIPRPPKRAPPQPQSNNSQSAMLPPKKSIMGSVFRSSATAMPVHCRACGSPLSTSTTTTEGATSSSAAGSGTSFYHLYGWEDSAGSITTTTSDAATIQAGGGSAFCCHDCRLAQSLLDYLAWEHECWTHHGQEQAILQAARHLIGNSLASSQATASPPTTSKTSNNKDSENDDDHDSDTSPSSSIISTEHKDNTQDDKDMTIVMTDQWPEATDENSQLLLQILSSPAFDDLCSRNGGGYSTATAAVLNNSATTTATTASSAIGFLVRLRSDYQNGDTTYTECLALLDLAAPPTVNTATGTIQQQNRATVPTNSLLYHKQQALYCANDMGTALQILYDQALCSDSTNSFMNSNLPTNTTCLLQAVLDFFIDTAFGKPKMNDDDDDDGSDNGDDDNNLESVAFYWPQLCHVHLCMLPATDGESLARITLMQDFLLTMACRSLPLALECIWLHWADVEEAMEQQPTSGSSGSSGTANSPTAGDGNSNGSRHGGDTTFDNSAFAAADRTRRRRPAVMLFLIELEALLFANNASADQGDDGYTKLWGNGGPVTVARFFQGSRQRSTQVSANEDDSNDKSSSNGGSASNMATTATNHKLYRDGSIMTPHQMELVSWYLRQIKSLRLPPLARSVRRETLRQETPSSKGSDSSCNSDGSNNENVEDSSLAAAHQKLQVAKRCEYLSAHLEFTKRLGNLADRLFTTIPNHTERQTALVHELERLNASGSMGGDPLNRVVGGDQLTSHATSSKLAPPIDLPQECLTRVVRVPAHEGHVFRSKERTPVLLLMEVVTEGVAAEEPITLSSLQPDSSTSTAQSSTTTSDSAQHEPSNTTSSTGKTYDDNDETESIGSRTPKSMALKKFGRSSSTGSHPSDSGANNDGAVVSSSHTLTPKQDVQKMVSNVVGHQKRLSGLVGIPDLTNDDGSSDDCDLDIPSLNNSTTDAPAGEQIPPPPDVPDNSTATVESESADPPLGDAGAPEAGATDQTARRLETSGYSTPTRLPSGETSTDKPRALSPSNSQTPEGEEPPVVSNPRVKRTRSKSSTLATTPDAESATKIIDTRREVLNVLMMKGIKGDAIAAGTTDSVQRSLQDLERKHATEILMHGNNEETNPMDVSFDHLESTTHKMASLGIGSVSPKCAEKETVENGPASEEDEVMESIRLLLIQSRVAQGHLSREDAAKVLQHASLVRNSADRSPEKDTGVIKDFSETPTIDAGDVDARLVGCGPLPPAVLQALTLWKGGMVSNGELLELVKRDMEFIRHSVLLDVENVDKLNENSDFWGRFAFGERWAEKKSRIAASSPLSATPGWDLLGVIVKANDDLRQESFIMQLILLCKEAFELAGLELWVFPYKILATGRSTGMIEMVRNAMSFDALKKRPGYGKGGLREHLQRMAEFTANPGDTFKSAQENFVKSLAAYSLMSYFFMFKDRHNGNILLDTAGHVIHIDFGFVFGTAPGGSFSLEMSTPFKLTEEMLDVMGGLRSPLFSEFVTLFCCGFLALQSHYDTFVTIVAIMSRDSTFPCFQGGDAYEIVAKLRERFCPDFTKEETVAFALDLIKQATSSYGTRQYDLFQYMSQGIAA